MPVGRNWSAKIAVTCGCSTWTDSSIAASPHTRPTDARLPTATSQSRRDQSCPRRAPPLLYGRLRNASSRGLVSCIGRLSPRYSRHAAASHSVYGRVPRFHAGACTDADTVSPAFPWCNSAAPAFPASSASSRLKCSTTCTCSRSNAWLGRIISGM